MKEATPFFIAAIVIFCITIFGTSKIPKDTSYDPFLRSLPFHNGQMTKIKYEGHTYIAWSCNFGCSMVHDPDCKCLNQSKATKFYID